MKYIIILLVIWIRGCKICFCDVSKAFDKVWHKGLLFKLKLTGVNEQIISWIESYLSARQQKVVSEGCYSTLKGINASVYQGSVLAPSFSLFNYINDIEKDINNDIRLFADNTSLFVVIENYHAAAATSLTEDLNVISNWAVQFNPKKYSI